MKNALLSGTIASILAPAAAFAGGVAPTPAPAPAPIVAPITPVGTDWTGAYGGIQLEYGDVDADPNAGDGALYGVFGGYRYDFGNVVVGGELDLNFADIDLEGTTGTTVGSLDSVHRLGVEVGYDAGPALIYGTVGVAQASAEIAGVDYDDTGYFFGAGMDYMVTDQITLGAEVLQHEFEDFDGTGNDISATTFGINAAFRF
ncbi:outer membrane beta-barrel protein [Gymnodinialimonas sp. 57CJ19]|uniref:outer membrane protein n=1 Tax=Gymnodinialimonas sp. 57CJ19 TaxID=3138498 RepID=UPI003134305F